MMGGRRPKAELVSMRELFSCPMTIRMYILMSQQERSQARVTTKKRYEKSVTLVGDLPINLLQAAALDF